MADCCDESSGSPLELIAAGLATLPRQLRTFPEIRRDLLAMLPTKRALAVWRPSGDDLGLMWLEMWSVIGDVLGFYDARIANDSYLRTAARRRELSRVVALLGYTPRGGVGGTAEVAVLAKGRESVTIPAGTAFRSRAFSGGDPQVFQADADQVVHPLQNKWIVEPYVRRPTRDPDSTITIGGTKDKGGKAKEIPTSVVPIAGSLLFETAGFGLSKDDLVLFEGRDPAQPEPVSPAATRVVATEPVEGKDGRTYTKAIFDPPISIPPDYDLHQLRVRRAVQWFSASQRKRLDSSGSEHSSFVRVVSGSTEVTREGAALGMKVGDVVVVARNLDGPSPSFLRTTIHEIVPSAVLMAELPKPTAVAEADWKPTAPAVKLQLRPTVSTAEPNELTFHHDFVDAGRATNVGRTDVGVEELTDPEGVPIAGIPAPPPAATLGLEGLPSTGVMGVLQQAFLVSDAAGAGARLEGEITFYRDGRASFVVLDPSTVPAAGLKLPMTIYGNVVQVSRGEQVGAEVLGSGDARSVGQSFELKKKPLTYLSSTTAANGIASTLTVRVDGVVWDEVPSFYDCGPDDRVYIVRHDEEQRSFVTFGDGERGARLPSGVKNVIATYRFGAGFAAPPAGAINQLAGATRGIDGVVSPVAASPGQDPEGADELRTAAPKRAVLLGRAVSVADVEALVSGATGIVRASARWAWLEDQMQAGIQVRYIGDAPDTDIGALVRAHADPTVPISVMAATPIAATLDLGVEVHPRYDVNVVAAAVADHLLEPEVGLLDPRRAEIGGVWWPSRLYEAVMQVPGVVGVSGVSITTQGESLSFAAAGGTCIPSGRWLDFTGTDAVWVSGLSAVGVPSEPAHGGGS